MDETFHFEYPSSKKSQYELLQDAISTLDKLEYKGLANKLREYVSHRQMYIEHHTGKYVQVTEDNIKIIDET